RTGPGNGPGGEPPDANRGRLRLGLPRYCRLAATTLVGDRDGLLDSAGDATRRRDGRPARRPVPGAGAGPPGLPRGAGGRRLLSEGCGGRPARMRPGETGPPGRVAARPPTLPPPAAGGGSGGGRTGLLVGFRQRRGDADSPRRRGACRPEPPARFAPR